MNMLYLIRTIPEYDSIFPIPKKKIVYYLKLLFPKQDGYTKVDSLDAEKEL